MPYRGYRMYWVTDGVLVRDAGGEIVTTADDMSTARGLIDYWMNAK